MRWIAAIAPLAVLLGGCVSRSADVASTPLMWPPAGAPSPGEVVFRSALVELKAGGVAGVLRKIAGAPQAAESEGLLAPIAVAVASDRLCVVDSVRNAVSLSTMEGRSTVFLPLPEGFRPVAVASAPGGREVWVADGTAARLRVFSSPDGRPVREVSLPEGFGRCGGIAVTASGDILVTDMRMGEVLLLEPRGSVKARTGRRGDAETEFNYPGAIAVARDGSVWVVDTFNFRLRHLDAALRPLGGFGEAGDGSGHFALPKGLALDPDGNIYVSDARFDVVQVFDAEGRLLLVIGRHGKGPGEFSNPAGVFCDTAGTLTIADTGNRRIQVLRYQRRSER